MNAPRTIGSPWPSRADSTWVVPADASAPFDRYVERVSALARLAHAHGVAVEAEVGELPSGVPGHGSGGGSRTDPSLAARFVSATGFELLAVSVGHVHVKAERHPHLWMLTRVSDWIAVHLRER